MIISRNKIVLACLSGDPQGLSDEFWASLLDKNPRPLKPLNLDVVQTFKPITSIQTTFGEAAYKLVYWDHPNENDDEETIVNGQVLREFEQLSFDSVQFYLGLGQDINAKSVKPALG